MIQDPLSLWRHDADRVPEDVVDDVSDARAALRRLPRYLDVHAARARKGALPRFADDVLRQGDLAALGISPSPSSVRFAPEDLPAAMALARRIWSSPDADEPWAEQWLLHGVGFACDASAVGFFREALARRAPSDPFAAGRRTYALAALAWLAAVGDCDAARAALRAATRHPAPVVRAAAAIYAVVACRLAGRCATIDVLEDATRLARTDPALEPRLVARQLLDAEKLPEPMDTPEGTYLLRASGPADARPSFGVEAKSAQSFAQLHVALQRATRGAYESEYAFYLPGEYHGGRFDLAGSPGHGRPAGEVLLGELGLLAGHRFRYRASDGGETMDLVLVLEVAGVRAATEPGASYPRIRRPRGAQRAAPAGEGAQLTSPPAEIPLLKTHVNGTKFYDAPAVAARLQPGDALALRREPTNSYDDRAIEVVTPDGKKLGYVPRTRNRALAQMLDAGEALRARLEAIDGEQDWPFVAIEVLAVAPATTP